MVRFAAIFAPVAAMSLCVWCSGFAQTSFVVQWKDQRLSVAADGALLAQVLSEVGMQTGVKFRGLDQLHETVSVRFSRLALRQGLERLLANVNYGLVESPHTSAIVVTVFDRGGPKYASRPTTPGEVASSGPDDRDPNKRLEEILSSAKQGDLGPLRQAASDSDETIRSAAFRLLAQRDPGAAAAVATAAAHSPDLAQRLTGIEALGQLDDPRAVQDLTEALADPDLGVKEYAIRGLAAQSGPDSIQALKQTLNDPTPSVRLMALDALADKGQAPGIISSELHSDDPLLRARAAELMGQMGSGE